MQAVEQFSLQAEQSVLGALLLDNDSMDRMGDLRAEHFYRADHRAIFAELMSQLASGKAADVISVFDGLHGKIEDGLPYLNSLAQNTPSSSNIGRYAGIVKDRAIKRALMALGSDLMALGATSAEDAGVLVDRASTRLEGIAEARIRQEPVRASEEMVGYVEELEKRADGTGPKAISTGFPDVDKRLSGGMRRGELIVVAARPKMGKTAFSLNVAMNVAEQYSVLFLSMEMPKAQIHDRNMANLGRIPLSNLLEPEGMTPEEWTRLTHAIHQIDNHNLYLDDQGGLRLLDVRMKAKQVKRRHGLDVLIVDYLQLMDGDGDNRNAQIEGITRGLKALAKELGIAIILLSQLNRELEKRQNRRPQPSDLRDSGAIEQDADCVIFLYRDEVYDPDTMDKGLCEIDVALCRQGAPGRVALAYIGEQTRFENALRWTPPAKQSAAKRGNGLAAHL